MKTVVVTGFGPFMKHKINASWEAVKLLPDLNLENNLDINLVAVQIPVTYDDVNCLIPELWEFYNPDLVIHVGVSHIATTIMLESTANKSGYFKSDAHNCKLRNGVCNLGREENIKTQLDLEKVINGAKSHSVDLTISNDAHRYLCEYIYYVSLSINKERTLFLHVPVLSETHTAETIANGIKIIIKVLLEQLKDSQVQDNNECDKGKLISQEGENGTDEIITASS